MHEPRRRDDLDDLKLLQQVAEGDRRAFESLYHRYYQRLFRYVFKVTRRPDLVEETVNDVMVAIWRGAARFEGRSRPSTWILGIAYRRAMKTLSRHRPRLDDAELTTDPPSPREGADSLMARRELSTTIGQALGELSPEQRAVVELAYYDELPYREIAEIVDCPVNTVKTRMFHARRKLREILPALGVADAGGERS